MKHCQVLALLGLTAAAFEGGACSVATLKPAFDAARDDSPGIGGRDSSAGDSASGGRGAEAGAPDGALGGRGVVADGAAEAPATDTRVDSVGADRATDVRGDVAADTRADSGSDTRIDAGSSP